MNSVIASLIAEWYGETNILGISFVQWSDLFLIFVSQPGGTARLEWRWIQNQTLVIPRIHAYSKIDHGSSRG